MEVNDFEILLIDVTFYLQRVQKLVFIMLTKIKKKNENNRDLQFTLGTLRTTFQDIRELPQVLFFLFYVV